MERRKAMATALAGAVTLGLGTVCLAAIGGAPMLGLAAAEQVKTMTGVTEVQMIDRVVVIRSGSTVPVDPAVVQLVAPETAPPVGPAPAPAPTRAAPAGTTASAPAAAWPAATPSPTPSPTSGTIASSPAAAAPATPAPATTAKATTTPTPAPVTTAKPVVTTIAPTTTKAPTTTLPRGVPRDWPAGKPIPPMPANCQDPQLELNGVWNCDD